jgi:Reverse transcriptase (RNA-dependent DNA polymerase)
VCALVLLDLSSAFDTVDHDTLLHVMIQWFGVDGPALAWFGSYLADRTQVFHYNTLPSGPHTVNCSVPQRSVLGPQEFIAYTEELTEVIDGYQLGHHLYADDIQLVKTTHIIYIMSTIQTLQQCFIGHQ